MSIIVIIQARMSSTRLPNKVLKLIVDKPMLQLQIERIQQAQLIDKIIVATSKQESDDCIDTLCQQLGLPCYRGSLDDVLDRFYQASLIYQPKHIVRITGDCPLIDSNIIDRVIKLHINNSKDYTSNCTPPTLPDGLDVEVFTFKALKVAWQLSKKPSEREHVTPFFRNNPELFSSQNFSYQEDLSHLRWTVDEPKDFEFVSKVYQELYQTKPSFALKDILSLLEKKPLLQTINQELIRNEGLLISKRKDKELGYD